MVDRWLTGSAAWPHPQPSRRKEPPPLPPGGSGTAANERFVTALTWLNPRATVLADRHWIRRARLM